MFAEILSKIGRIISFKRRTYQVNEEYLVKVSELMTPRLKKPRRKITVLHNGNEFLPIIYINSGECSNEI